MAERGWKWLYGGQKLRKVTKNGQKRLKMAAHGLEFGRNGWKLLEMERHKLVMLNTTVKYIAMQ